ncbi:MAG: FecR/PupR family sigma factor regulator [Symbiopectobacterium sp.]|uniref:FecR/PupR family sigma factor regulator n=1 Tax=Symbiopectobacterium sp. TaxID=2952789 RepID=UPI0039EC531B
MSTGPDVQTDPLSAADIDEQAALWFARSQNRRMPRTQRQALEAWLARSAQHRQAFESMVAIWRDAAALPRPALASRPTTRRFT